MRSRHRKTSVRRVLAFSQFLSLQRQAIFVSAFAAGRKLAESFALRPWLPASPALLRKRRQIQPGNFLSSEVISTMAARSTSSQPSPRDRTVPCVGVISRLRIHNSVYLRTDFQRLTIENTRFVSLSSTGSLTVLTALLDPLTNSWTRLIGPESDPDLEA